MPTYPPSTFVAPNGGTFYQATQAVAITICDSLAILSANVYYNGTNITSSLTKTTTSSPGCHAEWEYNGSVSMNPGPNPLSVIATGGGNSANWITDTVSFVFTLGYTRRVVSVVPATGATEAPPSTATSASFTVTNLWANADTFALTASCTGAGVHGPCTHSPSGSVVLAGRASTTVTVTDSTTATSGAVGTLHLKAASQSATGNADSGATDITVTPALASGLTFAGANGWPAMEEDHCVEQSLRPRAAAVCGYLRLVHALPSVKTINKTRTPVLLYNQLTARPTQNLMAQLTLPSGTTLPDSVTADVLVRGTGTSAYTDIPTTAKWAGSDWTANSTRRLSVDFDMGADTTGLYDLVLVAHVWYTSTLGTVVQDSAHTQLVNVNRAASPFGAGWWLAGLEQIFVYSATNQIAWVDGDGSTRVYGLTSTNLWQPTVYTNERDSITYNTSAGTYTRHGAHGVQVLYSGSGRHYATVDRLGHWTNFFYAAGGSQTYAIDSIEVPASSGSLSYQFAYGGNGVLSTVSAPSPTGRAGTKRVVSFTSAATGYERAGYRINAITDPDTSVLHFGYGLSGLGMLPDTLVDKRGGRTHLTYDNTGALASSTVILGGSQASLVTTIRNASLVGFAASWATGTHAAIPDSAYTMLIDPRSDTTRLWLDAYGEPRLVRDALGEETEITRSNATYPTLPTRIRDASQRVVVATYDARGNLSAETDSSNIVSGAAATTQYTYDPRWDFVTQQTNPAGDGKVMQYDTLYGNPQWAEPLGDSAKRVTFSYWSGLNLLAHAVRPVEAPASTTYYYDGNLGDLNTVITPLNYTTNLTLDSIGRVVTTTTPIDGTHTHTVTAVYDPMDRVTSSVSSGPSLTDNMTTHITLAYGPLTTAAMSLTVATTYDAEGNTLTVGRVSSPDPDSIGTMTLQWVYDSAGRMIKSIAPDLQYDSSIYDPAGNRTTWLMRRRNGLNGAKDLVQYQYDALNRMTQRTQPADYYAQGYGAIPHQAPEDTIFTDKIAPTDWSWPFYYSCPTSVSPSGSGYCTPWDTASYGYDRVGHMTAATNGDARVIRRYNPDGTLATDSLWIRDVNDETFSHVYGLTYQYDLDQRRTALTQPSTVAPGGGAGSQQLYSYDVDGDIDSIVDVLGNAFHHTYDLDGRLTRVSSNAAALHWTFDADDRVTAYADSTPDTDTSTDGWASAQLHYFQKTYDQRDKLTSVYEPPAGLSGSTPLLQVWNAYDGMGAVVDGLTMPWVSGTPSEFAQETYVTDAFGNVRSSWSTAFNGSSADSESSAYIQRYLPGTGRFFNRATVGSPIEFTSTGSFFFDSAGNVVGTFAQRQYDVTNDESRVVANEYYNAINELKEIDKRQVAYINVDPPEFVFGSSGGRTLTDYPYIEEYRYDALGRRIWKRARANSQCSAGGNNDCYSSIERYVYDGSQVLYEIRRPGGDSVTAAALEVDTGATSTYQGNMLSQYGRVLYTNGTGLDQPLDVIRMGYDTLFPGPVQFIPLQDWRGGYDIGVFASGAQYKCSVQPAVTTWQNDRSDCIQVDYIDPHYGLYFQDNYLAAVSAWAWNGDILTGSRDASGQQYRRNRYYDPGSGRFSQEDPIGLAGGLNEYGFAAGDPVNYSDPFGLCPNPHDPQCPTGGAGTASFSQGVFSNLNSTLQPLAPINKVGPTNVGVSVTAGSYSVSGDVGDGKASANHSLVAGAPQLGASLDVGFKAEAPEGAITGSFDFGLGKHSGISVNGYYSDPKKYHFRFSGITLHIGATLSACEACPSLTTDLNPQH